MTEQSLHTSSGKIAYFRFGTGPELLIAIPGYGDRAVFFEQLKESLSPRYTVYALQLPLHGESDWSGSSFSKKDFAEAIEQIKNKEQKKEVALMGYSFGGRVVCTLLESSYSFVKEIYLLAPDGFNRSYIRRATLLPKSFRYALQRMLNSPAWYLWLAKSLHKVGLLKTYSLHFVERNMATAKRRKRLFLFWNSMDDFQYDEERVAALLEKHQIKTTLILGKEDRVIPTERWRLWGERQREVKVILLEEEHRVVGGELDGVLREMFKEKDNT